MYRNSTQNYGHVKFIPPNALPSPDNTSDSDVEILDAALDEKRRQLDEEIARFKATKDREFRDFERQLRVKRTRISDRTYPVCEPTPTKQFTSTSSGTASVLNLLASTQSGSVSGWARPRGKRDGDIGDKVKRPPPLSGPTLSLDKLNIAGKTTPPLHSLGTPPSPTLLKRSRSRSPADPIARPTTPPSSQPEEPTAPPLAPTPIKDRSDPFAGVFTPTYLPLLESCDQRPVLPSPRPLPSTEAETQRLQLDADSKQQAERQCLESSQSLPPQKVAPPLLANKRALSSPVVPSASLPSALRTASGGGRKRKHVMFQLADLKVVLPSSSYEEGPSPELEERDHGVVNHELAVPSEHTDRASNRGNGSPRLLGETEKKRGKGSNGRFVSPVPSPLPSPTPSPVPSPAFQVSSPSLSPARVPHLSSSARESGFSGGLSGTDDGGSGVGFFELDEELASPGLREGSPADAFDLDALDEDMNEKTAAAKDGLGLGPSVQVGSVPIDIVRPSFIGSYGH